MDWQEITFETPWAFAMMAAAPLVVWLAMRSYAWLGRGRRAGSAAVRVLALAAIATALASPIVPEEEKRLCRTVAVDVSLSVPDGGLDRALDFITRADRARRAGDSMFVLLFASRPAPLPRTGWKEVATRGAEVAGLPLDGEQTDIAAAAVHARSIMPEDCSRRLVIVTDGNDTVSEAGDLVGALAASSLPVDVVGAEGGAPVEVIADDLHAPAAVRILHPFRLRASLYSSAPRAGVEITLFHQGPTGGRETVEERIVDLPAGETGITFTTQVKAEGDHLFRVEIAPGDAGDRFPENNFYEAATVASGPPMVIYVDGEPSKGSSLVKALETAGYEVDLRGAGGLPGSLADLAPYVAVFVSDVPASALPGGKVAALKSWVKAGGLLVTAGGKDAYQMGGWRGNPIEPFLPVSLDVPTDVEKTSAAVVLVIDTSGSMSGAPIAMAREAAKASVSVLSPDDLVEVISFDSVPKRLFMMQKAQNQMMINSFISKLRAGGGTDIVKALDLAYRDIAPVQAKKKHIVLLTDGQSSMEGVDKVLQNAASQSITISTIGLGPSVNQAFLEKIANATGGKASFTNDPKNLPRLFMKEMRLVTPSSVVEGVLKVKVAKQAPFLAKAGSGGFPYLKGYNLTTPKGGSASPVLVSDRGDPLLAMWKQGQGWVVSFTSDVKPRWASSWVKWEGFARFWGALVASLTPAEKKTEEVHTIDFSREGRLVTAAVDLVDRDSGSFIDGMTGMLTVRPFGGSQEDSQQAVMSQVAPGRYEGDFIAAGYGTWVARAEFIGTGGAEPAAGSLEIPYPPEYRRMGLNSPVLAEIAKRTGGRVDPRPEDLWKDDSRQRSFVALWPWLLAAFLVILPLDILVRRLGFARRKRG